MKNLSKKSFDVYGFLSSVWILASNDENPIMTYEGISHRLGVNNTPLVRSIIVDHQELFRLYVSPIQLMDWKDDMRQGKRLPGWIREMSKAKMEEAINDLSGEDVFRSQFRVERDAPKTPIEVIQWGLEHIDRLRKADLEGKTTGLKFLEVWGALILSFINLVLLVLSVFNIVE